MTREEAINEINKVFTPAYANYIVTALTEGATVSDIQHRWGRAYEAGVKDGLEQKPCEDAVSVASVFEIMGNLLSIPYDFDRSITEKDVSESMDKIRVLPRVTPQESRWIPVTERLPEEDGGYLVTVKRGYVTTAVWIGITKLWKEVTAWMPLPEPYKEDKE